MSTLWLAFLLAACASIPTPQERQGHADTLAAANGWQSSRIPVGRFDLVSYVPRKHSSSETLTIYIEGDGFAWVTGSTPSADPTPREPLALKLALAQSTGNAVYLARPCQYVDAERTNCVQRYWMEQRFAPEVIDATDKAVDSLKARFDAQKLVLVGYSGGGAVAALVAAQRSDVSRLVTVAGNLDHRAWTKHHRVEPLAGSLNAADIAERLKALPQTHYVGEKDRVIPPALAIAWPRLMRGADNGNLRIIPGFDHACCWVDQWPSFFQSLN